MNVKELNKKEKNTAELTMSVTPEEFEAAINKAYLKRRGEILIPGFRKGKAPRRIIENAYGTGVFYEDAIESLAPDALEKGIEESNLSTVGRPSIKNFNVGDDKSLTIVFMISIYPEVTVGEYKGIAAPKRQVTISDEEVDQRIESVRSQNARIEMVDRPARQGDIVNIDFEGYIGGVPFDGGKGEGHDLELGSDSFVDGFEDQLIGKSAGEDVEVNVTFPTEYNEDLAGKDATFKVKVNEVKEKLLPDLDDEFAKDVSEFDTIGEYRNSILESIRESKEHEADDEFKEAVLNKLLEGVQCEIPDAMVEEQMDNDIENLRYKLSTQGIGLEQYLSVMGMDLDSFRKHSRADVEKQIKADLAFEAIAKSEDFPVSDEDVEAEYNRLKDLYKVELDDVKKLYSSDAVITGLKIDAAHKLVYSTAVAEDAPAEE